MLRGFQQRNIFVGVVCAPNSVSGVGILRHCRNLRVYCNVHTLDNYSAIWLMLFEGKHNKRIFFLCQFLYCFKGFESN